MNDDQLADQLQRTLSAKAEQVRAGDEQQFDPAVALLETVPAPRRAWLPAIAAAIIVIFGVAAVAVAVRRDSGPGLRAVPSTTTTTEPLDLTVHTLDGWLDVPDAAPDGSVPVGRFNDALDAQRPPWAASAVAVALAFTHFPEDTAIEHGTVTSSQQIDAAGRLHIALTHRGLGDDSIAAERYELVLTQPTDHAWRLDSAQWSQQCQPNRGHQDFTREICI